MSLPKILDGLTSLDEISVIQDSFTRLCNNARARILQKKMSEGSQVGMKFQKRGKPVTLANGKVDKVEKRYTCKVRIVAPAKFGGRVVRADLELLHEPFNLTPTGKTPISDSEDIDEFSEADEEDN